MTPRTIYPHRVPPVIGGRTYGPSLWSFQEELDWEIYERYGLTEETERLTFEKHDVPRIRPGERAFESYGP